MTESAALSAAEKPRHRLGIRKEKPNDGSARSASKVRPRHLKRKDPPIPNTYTLSSEASSMEPLYERPSLSLKRPEFHKRFLQAVYPHVASFNTFIYHFIPEIVKDLSPVYVDPYYVRDKHELDPFYLPTEYLKIYIRSVKIGRPVRADAEGPEKRLFPRTCRNGHLSYSAPLYVEFAHDNPALNKTVTLTKNCGLIPIMVRSKLCHLHGMTPKEMIEHGEECNEAGGYFIINGNERVIRFVVQQRCNHPIALKKPRFRDRDLFFTDCAVLMRCAKRDGTSTANILFYTEDRQCAFRALVNRQEVVVPFWTLLRALMPTLTMDLVKRKLFETELAMTSVRYEGTREDSARVSETGRLAELEMLWKDFVDQETLFSDIDKYENRYLHLLGKTYWDLVSNRLRPGARYEDAGRLVIDKHILVHCDQWTAKFEALILMYRKLMALVRGEISAENIDSFAYQEVATPGHLFAGVLKDALFNALQKIRLSYQGELRIAESAGEQAIKVIRSQEQFELILRRVVGEISHTMNYFLATGNIKTFQLDVQQLSGWTVVADRLNVNRFLSHFRAVHRGQFFAQMRTTEVRKLLGETWGFLCPVHTPDGGPCGLLLHLAQGAIPVTDPPDGTAIAAMKVYLHRRGIPVDLTGHVMVPPSTVANTFPLVFDGQPLCRLPRSEFDYWQEELRRLKRTQEFGLPQHLEVASYRAGTGAFEGIFVFSYPGRLVRAVKCLKTETPEWIGPLGQPWMDIACLEEEVHEAQRLTKKQQAIVTSFTDRPEHVPPPKATTFKDLVETYRSTGASPDQQQIKPRSKSTAIHRAVPVNYTHVELSPGAILSITSALTPFSNHNQSPRNMYQCQMLKQTMATPFHSVPYRTDNKAYRLMFPQLPCVRTKEYRDYNFDEYPSGTNAIVAVISYTGYDMEDAMILNKSSMERGAFHGVVYKTKIIDAAPASASGFESRRYIFSNQTPTGDLIVPNLGPDGLPLVGTLLTHDAPMYRTTTIDALSSETAARNQGHVATYHDDEPAYVEKVNLIAPPEHQRGRAQTGQRVSLKLRCVRNPIVGDKFASRAGQKGILSMLYPHEDMPFTASGIVPDIVFNPHGFPSRMTVGMLIESMAGKAAAIHGSYQDCTPFREFPRQEKSGIPWIDQGAYNGWVSRGGRYMTPEEDEAQQTDASIDYFGKALLKAGYQYYGSEPMYSGIHGTEMNCHIFIGVIYYQRLRHMVSDKWQVRSTGPVDALTRQPVKGRKRGGGVRFGEMERDALLAHGATCLLQDRLLHCSDEHRAFVCPSCGSVLSPSLQAITGRTVGGKKPVARCRVCDVPCRLVALPFVFRYICNELAAMNVTIRLQLSSQGEVLRATPQPSIPLDPSLSLDQLNREAEASQPAQTSERPSTTIESNVDEILGLAIVKKEDDIVDESGLLDEEQNQQSSISDTTTDSD